MAGRLLLWGYHPVAEALRAGRREIRALYVIEDQHSRRLEGLAALAVEAGVVLRTADAITLTAMAGHRHHQGVVAEVGPYPPSSVEAILNAAGKAGEAPFVLVLDQIVDPQNLGAITRTAHCVGLQGIILPKNRSAPPTAAASKASAGALEHMRLAYVTNLVQTINRLKSAGLWIAGADQRADQSLYDAELTGALALVIGGEEKGIRPLVKKHCDYTIAIPQTGPVGSLNASAAAAVVMYEAFRQRRI